MANLKSSKKDIRRTARRTRINNRNRELIDKAVRATKSSINAGSKKEASKNLKKVYSSIDIMVKRKVLNKNAAARKKSRLAKKVNLLEKK